MCGRSPELFLGSKKNRKEKKSLGDVRKDRFKAFGGGTAAKKGQGKEKAPMFTEKKKVSGKSDGEVKPIRGMALCGPLGRAGRPHRPRGRKPLGLSPCDPASRRPGPSAALERPPPVRSLSPVPGDRINPLSPCLNGVHISARRSQMSAPHPPHPRPCFRSPGGSGWVGARAPSSSFVRCLDKGTRPFPSPTGVKSLLPWCLFSPISGLKDC